MQPKPELFASDYGAWFQDPLIVAAYPARPPYPPDVIDVLVSLVPGESRAVLDVGCGTGDIARRLAPRVARVDAIDASEAMLAAGRVAEGGDAANLNWMHSRVEDAPLDAAAYGLITAGESLHWLEWHAVMPRFARTLVPDGVLAIVDRAWDRPPPLHARLLPIFKRYSQAGTWQNVNLIDELHRRQLFEVLGRQQCGPQAWQPTMDEYIAARHSQRSFSRTHMGESRAQAFDAELRSAIEDACASGEIERNGDRLRLSVGATVTWGRPRG
ncbi:MAG: class I SAM-dependent methyltransferase [Chloroflexi bacterium]|nr:class I SAM-dependent methyltransferase [Chloroflexota bacterium]MBV9595638.1 class I SAM-dependent methyltransferase [Chloroflexota bacterium]